MCLRHHDDCSRKCLVISNNQDVLTMTRVVNESYINRYRVKATKQPPFLKDRGIGNPETPVKTLRPRQNGRHFAEDIFMCIFLNENVWNSIKISLKFVPKGPINNIPAFVQIMAWRRPGDKPLSEVMVVNLTTHICVTRPQWVKSNSFSNLTFEHKSYRLIPRGIPRQILCTHCTLKDF